MRISAGVGKLMEARRIPSHLDKLKSLPRATQRHGANR